jgi:hypothetical protein
MVKLLYEGKLAPMTSEFGFLECDTKTAANEFYHWQCQLNTKSKGLYSAIKDVFGARLKSITVVKDFYQRQCQLNTNHKGRYSEIEDIIAPNLKSILERLLPLSIGGHERHLFIPTRDNKWTACFDNNWRGTDATTLVSVLAEKIGCRGIRVSWVPNTIRRDPSAKHGWRGNYGAVIFEVYGPKERTVELVNDGGINKWEFIANGEPFDFEKTEKYRLPRKIDRFTPEMLDDYLKHLGIGAFSEDFYIATKENPAKLVSLKGDLGYKVEECTLEQAREDY